MRIGCCGTPEQASLLREAGFEFLEINASKVLRGEVEEAEWLAQAPDPGRVALPMEAANVLISPGIAVVGPQRDLEVLKRYMSRVTARAARLGVRVLVFGSGGARRCPEGFDPAKALEQIREFLELAAEACSKHDLRLAIEHLNAGETNTLNRLAQTLEMARRVNHPRVGLLVDSYHFALEHETEEAIRSLDGLVFHVHVAEPVDRIEPGGHGPIGQSPKAFDFPRFFRAFRQIGYDERISFEGRWTRPVEQVGREVVAYLRGCWQQAEG